MATKGDGILLTGGSGRLGSELRRLMPDLIAPFHEEMDVTDIQSVGENLSRHQPLVIVHAAAMTDVLAAESRREQAWRVNVQGTRNVVVACQMTGVFLIHISTDYVFSGSRGLYRESDVPGPPTNYYALTKLVAEEVVRVLPGHLIIRTSFRGRRWPHPVAFTDLYTSQDYVDVIAPEIARAIRSWRLIPYRVLHIASERKSMYDLAKRRRPSVRPAMREESGVPLPQDVSLDTSLWQNVKPHLTPEEVAPR